MSTIDYILTYISGQILYGVAKEKLVHMSRSLQTCHASSKLITIHNSVHILTRHLQKLDTYREIDIFVDI